MNVEKSQHFTSTPQHVDLNTDLYIENFVNGVYMWPLRFARAISQIHYCGKLQRDHHFRQLVINTVLSHIHLLRQLIQNCSRVVDVTLVESLVLMITPSTCVTVTYTCRWCDHLHGLKLGQSQPLFFSKFYISLLFIKSLIYREKELLNPCKTYHKAIRRS